MSSKYAARGRLNALKRHRDPSDPAIPEAARDLRAEVLAEHIARVVAEAPPLTTEQCERLAMLLRPSAVSTPLDAA